MSNPMLGIPDNVEDIHQHFLNRFESTRVEILGAVKEWKWATGYMYHFHPVPQESLTGKPSKWLQWQKSPDNFCYGLSGDGLPLTVRSYGDFGHPDGIKVRYETFYFQDNGRKISLTYHHDEHYGVELVKVTQALLTEGKTSFISSRSQMHPFLPVDHEEETFYYDGGLLRRSTNITTGRLGSTEGLCEYVYDDNNELIQILGRSAQGKAFSIYQRPSPDRPTKAELKERVKEEMKAAARQCIIQFKEEHPDENWYGFAFASASEGSAVYCAFATEQSLDAVAEKYKLQSYPNADISTLETFFRWAGVEDGWYQYFLDDDCPYQKVLDQAFAEGFFDLYDGNTVKIGISALQELDQEGIFGIGAERERLVTGFTFLETFDDFAKQASKTNPPTVVTRLRMEIKQSNKAGEQLR
jgi:hypothetical protein